MAAARGSRRRTAEEVESHGGPVEGAGSRPQELATAASPPLPPQAQKRPSDSGRDNESLGIVFQMTKAAIDLQFSVAERLDTKVRTYFGFAATVYTVAQALVLRSDIHDKLGSNAGAVQGLAIGATVLLVATMVVTLNALRPLDEEATSEDNLRDLLERGFTGDERAGADGVNLMIGELHRRKKTNKIRNNRLTVVIVATAVTALVAFVQVVLAVEAIT